MQFSLFSHLFTDTSPVAGLREIGNKCRDRGTSFSLRLIHFTFGVKAKIYILFLLLLLLIKISMPSSGDKNTEKVM